MQPLRGRNSVDNVACSPLRSRKRRILRNCQKIRTIANAFSSKMVQLLARCKFSLDFPKNKSLSAHQIRQTFRSQHFCEACTRSFPGHDACIWYARVHQHRRQPQPLQDLLWLRLSWRRHCAVSRNVRVQEPPTRVLLPLSLYFCEGICYLFFSRGAASFLSTMAARGKPS